MADEAASAPVVVVGKSTASIKAKTSFSEEETKGIASLWNEEEVLFNGRHKDYFKNGLTKCD